MKKRGFDPKIWLITAGCAFVGLFIFYVLEWLIRLALETSTETHVFVNCVMTVLFLTIPLLTGWLGMRLAILLNRRYEIIDGVGGGRALLISLVACLLLGVVGQLVYAIEPTTGEETIPGKSANYDGTHVVLLIDRSASMWTVQDACDDAAEALIQGLGEENSMQIVAFAANVMDRNISEFLPLTAANKTKLINFLSNTFAAGGTDFNAPLNVALDTLNAHRDPKYRPVIIMLTDGGGIVYSDVAAKVKAFKDLSLYTVRIIEGDPNDSWNELDPDLADLLTEDFTIPYNDSGSVNVDEVLEAFRSAITDVSDPETVEVTKIGLGEDRLIDFENDVYWWRVVALLVTFILYGILLSYAYFGRLGMGALLLSTLSGCAFALTLLFLPDSLASYLVLIPYALIHLGALTFYQEEEGSSRV